ncbi:MAG TPA: hypothetical protein VN915_03250 [Elusimicrobiota bacterium]|nr:hypothetical protein [Elusimicrobiota bacterium]
MNRFIGVLAAAALSAACASAPRLSSAPALSKAKGTVTFKPTLYKGTKITLRIENLKDPEKLDPPGYSYVAWVQSERESPPQNVGALVIDPDLNGALSTTTPLHEFEFFVTAETSSDAAQPTGPPLFWIHKDRELTVTADSAKPSAALGTD